MRRRTTIMAVSQATLHPTRPAAARKLDEAAKVQIDRLFRRGVSPEILAGQFGLSRARIERVLTERRALRLLEQKLDFMPDPSYERPGVEAEILAPMPESVETR